MKSFPSILARKALGAAWAKRGGSSQPFHLESLEQRALLTGSSIPALILLDPSGASLNGTGNGGLLSVNGGIVVVNSTNPHGAVLTGNSIFSAAEFDFGGNPGYFTTGMG